MSPPCMAKINSYSATLTRERWQLFKWEVTSSTQSIRGITSNFPRDSPHDTFPLPKNEQASGLVDALALAMAVLCLTTLHAMLWSAAYNNTTAHGDRSENF